MSFLKIEGKKIVVCGVYNKKSIAYHSAKVLEEEGAEVILVVKDAPIKEKVQELFPGGEIFICNVEDKTQIKQLGLDITKKHPTIHGLVHAVAYANFSGGPRPFFELRREDFLQAMTISCFSLVELANAFKEHFDRNASVVTLSVPFTMVAMENYSLMAPVKAALESCVVYLAKSFSHFSNVRFNAVASGMVKTVSAAGIPDYMKHYIFTERATLRKKGVDAIEIANLIALLLSERSCVINGQKLISDAGASVNPFDIELVSALDTVLFKK